MKVRIYELQKKRSHLEIRWRKELPSVSLTDSRGWTSGAGGWSCPQPQWHRPRQPEPQGVVLHSLMRKHLDFSGLQPGQLGSTGGLTWEEWGSGPRVTHAARGPPTSLVNLASVLLSCLVPHSCEHTSLNPWCSPGFMALLSLSLLEGQSSKGSGGSAGPWSEGQLKGSFPELRELSSLDKCVLTSIKHSGLWSRNTSQFLLV